MTRGRVTDHKTTSRTEFIRTADELRYNVQAAIYATHSAALFAGKTKPTGDTYSTSRDTYPVFPVVLDGDGVDFRHVYYLTKGSPESSEVSVTFRGDELRERFAEVAETVRQMDEASRSECVSDLDPNLAACADYGGCPFAGPCSEADGGGPFAALFRTLKNKPKTEGSQMDFAEMLAKRTNKPEDEQTHAEEREPERPRVNPPDGVPARAEYHKPAESLLDAKAPVFPAELGDVVEGMSEIVGVRFSSMRKDTLSAVWDRLRAAIESRRVAEDYRERSEIASKKGALKRSEMKSDAILMSAILLGQTGAAPTKPDPVVVVEDEPDPVVVVEEPPSTETPVEILEPGPEKTDTIRLSPRKFAEASTVVFVGCHPRGVSVTYLDELVAPIAKQSAEKLEIPHYRIAEYGRGLDSVVGIFAARLSAGDLVLPAFIVVDPRSHYGPALVDLLATRPGVTLIERFGW